MIVTRPLRLTALILCLVALPASTALAGKKRGASAPSISSLNPLTLRVGDTLTIRGHHFLPGRKHNRVAFKRAGGPAIVVKAGEATKTRLKVIVPAALAKQLSLAGGGTRRSRFRVRVRAGRFATGYTPLKRSPLIGPALTATDEVEQLDGTDDGCEEAFAIDLGDDGAVGIDGIEGDEGGFAEDAADAVGPCSPDPGDDDLGDDGE